MGAAGATDMTTNVEWLNGIQAMTPTGVRRVFSQRPDSLTTADLPAAWPMLPAVEVGQPLSSCRDGDKIRTIGYMVAYNPINQDSGGQNLENIAALVDNLETAFDSLTVTEFIEYSIQTTADISIAGVPYYGLECEITGRNRY